MLRSMYSGISGMKVNQTRLDVIGNNISNVNTTGFKSSRARFKDMLNQNVSNAMAPSQNQGGTNASQVGLGVQLASIDAVMTQGNLQSTGRALDLAIDGEGFFMVSNGPSIYGDSQLEVNHRAGTHTLTQQSLANSGSEIMYTRDGSLILDSEGNLLTGDGYRVMGYSLTNDDSSMPATSQKPSNTTAAGLDFKFGPGSQLNGYKVVLGAVGPGTVTSADVDKAQKLIIVNGDFSETGNLTAAQIESAVNKGLSASGISQEISVSGTPISLANLGSDSILGGSDASAPKAVTVAGFTIQLTEGDALNGYTFEIGEVAADSLSVQVNSDVKKILINGDFINKGALSADGIKTEINRALSDAKINQSVKSVTGSAQNLTQITGQTSESVVAEEPKATLQNKDGSGAANFSGLTVTTGLGAALNGYTVSFGDSTGDISVTVDKTSKSIKIHGDLTGVADGTDKLTQLNNKVANALKSNGISGTTLTFGGRYEQTNAGSTTIDSRDITMKLSGGVDAQKPKDIEFGNGFTLEFPELIGNKKSSFDNYQIVIADVNEEELSVEVDTTENKIILKGNFMSANAVKKDDLQNKINQKLKEKGLIADTDKGVKISGSGKIYTGLTSEEVEGGEELKAPAMVGALGLEFNFSDGAALNGYKIVTGNISAGTKSSVSISEKNKTITINGDFVTQGAVSAKGIENALNNALREASINQSISVTGNPMEIGGTESEITNGGTPVQSLDNDGTVNFVDGTKDLKAYDSSLKTLKIPDKVKLPGSETELRVKSYTIDSSGIINGILEDGRVAALGQIAMASFKNPEGLTKMGGNLYSSSVNSGDPTIKSGVGTLGEDNSLGYGDSVQSMLEMSNVDLSEQFTEMIVATRAFQASGKMINTGDEILQDIINLKR